jgi:hypothetical protein
VARDQAELQRLRAAPSADRVAIAGSSRADNGFRADIAADRMPAVTFARLAHAMQDPITLRSLAPRIAGAGVDVVILILSETDTHRPVRIEPVPAKSTADLDTLTELMQEGGLAFSIRNRVALYRVGLGWLSNTYRFRDILGRSVLNHLREFPLDDRLEPSRKPILRGRAALGRPSPERLPRSEERTLLAPLPQRLRKYGNQLGWFTETTRGEHARVQMALIRQAVAQLRESGAQVIIVEGPVHPIAADLQGPHAKQEFRAFASELASDPGVRYLPLESMPPFTTDDFVDLLHLNQAGGEKLTAVTLPVLRRVLTETGSSR